MELVSDLGREDGTEAVDELDLRVGLLSAQLHSVSAALIDAVAAFDELGGADGFSTLSQWLSVRGGFSTGEARRLCALAGRVEELPTLMAHARSGQLSVGVLAAAARVADPQNEAAVAHIAVTATPVQSARILARYRTVRPAPESDQMDEPAPVPELDTWWRAWSDESGRGRIDAALSPHVAAMVQQAWEAARAAGEADAPITAPADLAEVELDAHRRLSADEIASRWAATMLDHAHDQGICRPGGDRHGLLVTIDVVTLARVLGIELDPSVPVGLGSHAFDLRTGAHLTDAEVAAIACDGDLQLLVHHDGAPLWLSDTARTANRHLRRALAFRSGGTGGCEYPGCTQRRYLDAHHVIYWGQHGPTQPDNLVLLCGHHHRELHRGDYRITTDGAQRFTFTSRLGVHLGTTVSAAGAHGPPPAHADRPRLDRPPDPPPHVGPDTPRSETHGERLTAYALDVFLERLLAA